MGLEWTQNPMAGILIRKICEDIEKNRGKNHMKTEAETGAMCPQAKESKDY